ncbi:tRNA (guanosine(46)-N7)-methyltransferase TrmB [Spiroplasma endosymbiont of 'Nebria riversi']|uniref:tRNA (guanosine(46)-N7)-methyltransferase TrmB n=1 Tax=Spiroplasma endosymbiont of 'Nebria riversi' TaxID=2792084 RepID=UPI001C03A442|nr:tRNA (guanosine(46)-N7)-methyltransferase TrmB [Spiroplasma endosymbiont of 'Nebria riversi']
MRLRNNPQAKIFLKNNYQIVIQEPQTYQGNWSSKIFNNTQPCHLEIGCGKGNFIIAMAHKYPMINFIAIEKSGVVLMVAVKKVVALEKIPNNLKFVQIDANNILTIFAINEITEIYLNFSDPWPKKKHYKRRLTHPKFLLAYKNILVNSGRILIRTDNAILFDFTINSLRSDSNWKLLVQEQDSLSSMFLTEYEKKFIKQNKVIYYLKVVKNSFQ